MIMDYDEDSSMTVKELLHLAQAKAQAMQCDVVCFDLPSHNEISDEPFMITVALGRLARNDVARLFNTFLELGEEEDV